MLITGTSSLGYQFNFCETLEVPENENPRTQWHRWGRCNGGGCRSLHSAFRCIREGEMVWGEENHMAWPAPALPYQEGQWCEDQVREGTGLRQKGLGKDESLKDTKESEDRGGCVLRMGRGGGPWAGQAAPWASVSSPRASAVPCS